MKHLQPFFRILILVLAVQTAGGQSTPAPPFLEPAAGEMFTLDPVGTAPSSLILDDARLFNERERDQLSARLKEFGAQHNVAIYIVAYSVLIGETIDARASRVKEKWLADKRGIILVYQRGTERMTFSSTANPENYVTRAELEHVFAAAYAQASQQSRGSSRVIAAANQLMSDLPRAIDQQANSNAETKAETNGFVAWALTGLVLLTAAGMFFFQFLRKAQIQVTKTYTFPIVPVKERFGAPYCGGHNAEIQFTAPSA